MKDQIFLLCEKAGYIVKVCKVNPNRCVTLFPDRLFGKPKYKGEDLVHEISKIDEQMSKIKRHDNKGTRSFSVPKYAVRAFILQDIYLKCGFLGINPELVHGYDEDNKKIDPVGLAIPKPDNVELRQESLTQNLYSKVMLGLDVKKEAQQGNVTTGMMIIDNFLKDTISKFMNQEILD